MSSHTDLFRGERSFVTFCLFLRFGFDSLGSASGFPGFGFTARRFALVDSIGKRNVEDFLIVVRGESGLLF